jgi:inner membrane protein
MPTVLTHAVVAGAIGTAFHRPGPPRRFWVLGALCAALPDADVVGLRLGVPFGSMLGHRGLSHSLVFAAGLAALVVAVGFPRMTAGLPRGRLWLYLFLATASHGVLAAMTDGGIGIAFLAPFDESRYFFALRPIVVSPLGIRPFFSEWGLRVIASELAWVWLPALVFAAACVWRRRLGPPAPAA